MGICATEYGLSGEFPSGRSRFFLCGAASCHGRRPPGFAGVASAKWPKAICWYSFSDGSACRGHSGGLHCPTISEGGRVTMIQAGIHVGAGVVLGVAAGWWLGIGNSRCRSRTRWRGSIACCTAPCWWYCSRHDGWLRRLGLLGLGLFCGSPAGLFGESGKPVRCERVLEPCADLHAGLRSAGDAGRGDGLRAPGTRVALTQALRSRRSQVTRFLAVFLQPAQHFHGLPARGSYNA